MLVGEWDSSYGQSDRAVRGEMGKAKDIDRQKQNLT